MEVSLFSLIIHATFFEQIIFIILLAASIISWAMIAQRYIIINNAKKVLYDFENSFWSGIDLLKFYKEIKPRLKANSGIQTVFCSGFREFSRLDPIAGDPEVIVTSVQRVMRVSISREEEYLTKHLSSLASIGSISPYIGLFGTVGGVMNAFLGIASAGEQTTLAAVAPGIAEALIATGMGLFAAIPAVWGYNAFSSKVDFILVNYHMFTEEFTSILNRKIRQKVNEVR